MIRIAITPAAFGAIAATLPLGSVGPQLMMSMLCLCLNTPLHTFARAMTATLNRTFPGQKQ